MRPEAIIRHKRNGLAHSESELREWIAEYVRGNIQDYQMAAWLMAVYFKGLNSEETAVLTDSMRQSGDQFERHDPESYWVDKHSTGGVGDKTSLLIVPLVHVVSQKLMGGGKVKLPMISGRSLGHTGGTLDKLESVPGFSPQLPLERAMSLLESHGFIMMGQTEQMVPADRRLYALRDATATVDHIALIVASILSKKLSESLNGIVFDVKFGGGALMKDLDSARELSDELSRVAGHCGLSVVSILSRMDEPLGYCVGNRLEVVECWQALNGEQTEPKLKDLTIQLSAQMLQMASRGQISLKQAESACEDAFTSPEVRKSFIQMFENQGGDWKAFWAMRPPSEIAEKEIYSTQSGVISSIDAYAVGEFVRALGGGRYSQKDEIDPWVGSIFAKKIGDQVERGDLLVKVIYRNGKDIPSDPLSWFKITSEMSPAKAIVEEVR